MSIKSYSTRKPDIKRTKIELNDETSYDSKPNSAIFDKTTIDMPNISSFSQDNLKRVYQKDKSLGDAIFSLLSYQFEFIHILTEFFNEFGNPKNIEKKELDKSSLLSDHVLNSTTLKHNGNLISSYCRLEKIEKEITNLLNWKSKEKPSSNKNSFHANISPPLSARYKEDSK
jgi:hypothetical protein